MHINLTCFKNGFVLELISMYELAYCPWFIVVATAATKGLPTRLGEVWNRVSILHSNQGVNKVYFFKTDPGF